MVWRDNTDATCRCWTWRPCTSTRLTAATARAVFVLDGLGPMDDPTLGREALTAPLAAGSRAYGSRTVRAPHPDNSEGVTMAGEPSFIELGVPDADRAGRFYSGL